MMKTKHVVSAASALLVTAGIIYFVRSRRSHRDQTSVAAPDHTGQKKIRSVMHHAKESLS